MKKEYSAFAEIARQQNLTKEEREVQEVSFCQNIVLSYAIARLHYYAYLVLDASGALAPQKMVVESLRTNAEEVEGITAWFFQEREKLINKFSSEDTSFEKQQEEIFSLESGRRQKMQKNLRGLMDIYFPRLSVVGLIHEQEEIMKFFLLPGDEYQIFFEIKDLNAYFYDIETAQNIEQKINKNKQKKGISFIGFHGLLLSIDKKYDIENMGDSFYNSIKECQCFANLIKHKSQKSYDDLLKYPYLFSPIETTIDPNNREPILSLNTFYRYIRSFEKFWIHILKNVHKPMECNEFIMQSHEHIDWCVQQYQKFPWNKEKNTTDSI